MAEKKSEQEHPIRIGNRLSEAFDRLEEQIRERAYRIFLDRGQEHGDSVADWLSAQMDMVTPIELELKEQKKNIIVEAKLKGFSAEDIEIEVVGNTLKVFGSHTRENNKNKCDATASSVESVYFYDTLALPDAVDLEETHAKLFKNGKLKVTLPRLKIA